MSDQDVKPELPVKPAAPEPSRLGVPKGVALAMGAGLVGLFLGGAAVAFTAAVVAPAIEERLKRLRERKQAQLPPPGEGTP